MNEQTIVSGFILDIHQHKIYGGSIFIEDGKIVDITEHPVSDSSQYICPGFVDAHIHIESSMLPPREFARLALPHGTLASVSDPHEIANVLGKKGIELMIESSAQTPMKILFGAPSCVPATTFETSGATITDCDIFDLFAQQKVGYLSEVMNFPGVLAHDPLVMKKIAVAKEYGAPIDGHAPGLRGADAQMYSEAGITTDHECTTLKEAAEKCSYGMKILIREGSAAKNFEALHPLISSHVGMVMFCSDDKHPHELVEGHINTLVARAVAKGHDIFDVLTAACMAPVQHYSLPVGLLRKGDSADFIILDSLSTFSVRAAYIQGNRVAYNGVCEYEYKQEEPAYLDVPTIIPPNINEYAVLATSTKIRVIEAIDGELLTNELIVEATTHNGYVITDIHRDILKIVVINRYVQSPPAVGFITNFGLKQGAIATTVAHDCHNIVAIGVDDASIDRAIRTIFEIRGGCVVCDDEQTQSLELAIAGLMSTKQGEIVAKDYARLEAHAQKLGSQLRSPFMTLSFMALLVIPALKMSDKGLFDGKKFCFTSVCV